MTRHLRETFLFTCLPAPDPADRARLEARLIATVASCELCRPSPGWLGHAAYAPNVKASGLWNAQHVRGPIATEGDLSFAERAAAELLTVWGEKAAGA